MQRSATSLTAGEMQINTTVSYQLTPVKMAIIKKTETTSVGKDVEESEPLCTADGSINWCSHSGKQYEGSSKNHK